MSTLVFYVSILGIITFLASFIPLKDKDKRELGQLLSKIASIKPSVWLQAFNQAFLVLFDCVYGEKIEKVDKSVSHRFSDSFWTMFPIILMLLIMARFSKYGTETIEMKVVGSFLLSSIYFAFFITFVRMYHFARTKMWLVPVITALFFLFIFYPTEIAFLTQYSDEDLLSAPARAGIFIVVIIFYLIITYKLTGKIVKRITINPLKAIVSSLVFMVVLGLSNKEAAKSFFTAINTDGFVIISFLGFNLFADVISIAETRWILQLGTKVRITSLLGLLVLDIILSAVIFLFLPMIFDQLPAFLEAAQFRGKHPWLGILFWTTFSTSVMFYIFIIASLIVRPLSHLPKLGHHIDVEKNPVKAIACGAFIAVTIIIWGCKGVAVIYKTFA